MKELPEKYYLTHFCEFLSYLSDTCRHLLDEGDWAHLNAFKALPEEAQCVFVRMLNRKGDVIKTGDFRYAEVSDIPSALADLEHAGFIQGVTEPFFNDWLLALNKEELIALAHYRLEHHEHSSALNDFDTQPLPKKSHTKSRWLSWVQHHVSPCSLMNAPFALMQQYHVIAKADVVQYWLFLYFGHLRGRLNQFSLRDMGIMHTHQEQHINGARFDDLDQAKSAFFFSLQNQNLKLTSDDDLADFARKAKAFNEADGQQAESHRDKLFYRLGKRLLSLPLSDTFSATDRDHLAMSVLELSHDPAAIEKSIRLLYQKGEHDEVQTRLQDIIDDPSSEHLLIFAQDFLQRKFHKKRTSLLTDLLRACESPISLDEAYRGYAEGGVIDHYQRSGVRAFHSENNIWRALFTLFFWHELYEHEASGFHSEFDFKPKLIKQRQFYAVLSSAIESRLQSIRSKTDLLKCIQSNWARHYGQRNGLFHWHASLLEPLTLLIQYGSLPGLIEHLRNMAKQFHELCDGYPDLMIIDDNGIRFEEIKAPGDQLRRNQLISLQSLKRNGFDVRVQTTDWKINPEQPYVIVDVETTGGRKEQHRVTEVGMVKVLNGEIVDEWQSLINPMRHIPQSITRLTGISNEMVSNAPVFDDVADEIAEFCAGSVFVAHNVNFDYGFFRSEFERLGRRFHAPKLCTVQMSRKYLPGHSSYSLGKLCAALDIDLENHHRALDDAKAAAHVFRLIQEKRQTS
ncbi:hypothetical protein HF888_12290 [Bermanella marisrubri]|uniref:Uncharacterized protein n=1 Tax=Bermanella marisrubri TaxID=207949 RepID=Q1MZX4_9GAMM|nr:exonuclease domain-containing protein [Bermanella marisrubri]EAT11589.1 hypothetical protein RED65_02924 [Oceanobacter sp. RED65] [Bermanella marisrubri]QIZ84950.1 hypothetical protein HF888_12290 [Bermanella marisrubri]